MNKKERKERKNIKRQLRNIGYKRNSKKLKKEILMNNREILLPNNEYHPNWRLYNFPTISDLDLNGDVEEGTTQKISINITYASETIYRCKNSRCSMMISCYDFQKKKPNAFCF